MKKLLLGACIMFGAILSANAQLPYLQNFETTMTSLPAGWGLGVATHHPMNPGWKFADVWPAAGGQYWRSYVYTHTYAAYVDDIDYNTTPANNYDTLYTSVFSCVGHNRVFIGLDLNFNNYTGSEVGTIAYSKDGGLTWATAVTLPSGGGDITWHNGEVFDLSNFIANQASVMLAFTWNNVGAVTQGYPGWGIAVDNISVYAPAALDLSGSNVTNGYLVTTGSSVTFSGTEFNWGGDSIVSMNLNYTVNGGPVQTDAYSSITVNRLNAFNFTHSVPWTPSSAGNYLVRFWADHINGSNADMNNSNDTLYSYYTVVDTKQTKVALFEEYTQASCNPCMYAGPNIVPVLGTADAAGYCSSFRYHTNWPGVDYMNNEIQTPFEGTRVSYYGVNGVPDGKIDGTTDVFPGSVTTGNIQAAANMGSPLTVTIKSCTFNTATNTYSLSADIKSVVAIPNHVIARVVLSVDTIKYASDQSTEDPKSSFAPPIGTGTNPDSYYPYVLNFPQVAEDMLPSATGTSLTPFTANQTQTINVTWKKNRPWGSSPKTNKYDSAFPGEHMVVFLQEDQAAPFTARNTPVATYPTHGMTGALTTYVYQSASAAVTHTTGIEELANGIYFNMYPNPTDANTTIEYSIEKSQNVKVDVYNDLGQNVYSTNLGKVESGQHTIAINGSSLKSGVYFVKFTTDNVTTTKKLVIQR